MTEKLGEYRKKPVVIEAYQTKETQIINTLEGIMTANPGDWIITGIKGEQYPCKPDIFEASYEPVTDSEKAEPQGVDEEKKIEEIRMMIQTATSEYMPVFKRIVLNDAVEVEIRKLLTQQKRVVSRDWLVKKLRKIEENPNLLWSRSIFYVEEVLKELGIEVVDK